MAVRCLAVSTITYMSNQNLNGSTKYWFDGVVAVAIDNGVPSGPLNTNNWVGGTNFWYQGTPQGYLQGGPGTVLESPQNIALNETQVTPTVNRSRAYALII